MTSAPWGSALGQYYKYCATLFRGKLATNRRSCPKVANESLPSGLVSLTELNASITLPRGRLGNRSFFDRYSCRQGNLFPSAIIRSCK